MEAHEHRDRFEAMANVPKKKSEKFTIIEPVAATLCLLEIYTKKCITFQTLYTYIMYML